MAGTESISVSIETGNPLLTLTSRSNRSLVDLSNQRPDPEASVSRQARCIAWFLPGENKHPFVAKVVIQGLTQVLLIPCPVNVSVQMKMFVGISPFGIIFQMTSHAFLAGIQGFP
jgi:hypothetical protein